MTADNRTAARAPAAERNKEPILQVLRRALPAEGRVLELASGTGQHVVHFAQALPRLLWQPSDPDPAARRSIAAWIEREALDNVLPPLDLDVHQRSWPVTQLDAVVCINMVHIAPWSATLALTAGAATHLPRGGPMLLYGPYRRHGQHTADSNAAFDRDLRARNPDWGIRDLEAVEHAAGKRGLTLAEVVEMPANNLCVVLRKC